MRDGRCWSCREARHEGCSGWKYESHTDHRYVACSCTKGDHRYVACSCTKGDHRARRTLAAHLAFVAPGRRVAPI